MDEMLTAETEYEPCAEDLRSLETVTEEELRDLGYLAEDKDATDTLNLYLNEIGKIPLLTKEEEFALGRAAAAGDVDAERRLTEGSLRLVVAVAKRFQGKGVALQDLIQEGNLGLMKAAERFDPERGCRFSTFATWWIRHFVMRSIANQGRAIRLPVHLMDTIAKMNRCTLVLRNRLCREPEDAEIAAELGISAERVQALRTALLEPLSLDAVCGEDDEYTLLDLIPSETAEDPESLTFLELRRERIQMALNTLNPREKLIVTMRFGLEDGIPRTLEEVGQSCGLTRERIRQIEGRAIRKLRRPECAELLKDFI